MLKPCPSRRFYLGEFIIILGLLAFAFYLQWYQGLVPCALCEAQRVIFVCLGAWFLVCSLFPLKKGLQVLINFLAAWIAVIGIIFAGRQVWLQYLPQAADSQGTCDASLLYMFKIMTLSELVVNLLLGGPECAKIDWTFLSLSIAAWSLLWFSAFFLLSLWQMLGWVFSRR